MKGHELAVRYAKTFIAYSGGNKSLEQGEKDFGLLVEVFKADSGLNTFLNSPVISIADKLSLLKKVFSSNISESTWNFIGLIARKNRLQLLKEISEVILNLLEESRKVKRATVISSTALSTAELDKIALKLREDLGYQYKLDNQQDPSLLGGFVVQLEDRIFDYSAKYKLNQIKNHLLTT